jgi:YfiH family protein
MLQASSLALSGIVHGFFARDGGVSNGVYATLNGGLGSNDAAENVRENRRRMAAALGVPDLVTCYQIHSADAVVAERPWTRENSPRADAIVTRVPGLAIGVTTADCAPILLVDHEVPVIGAAHAGWKGALTGIIEAAIGAMEKLGARRERMRVALGPMIRQRSYEVGPEFVARFLAAAADNERFFTPSPREGHSMFDLAGYIALRLERAGIERIEDLDVCTYADARFFSYRRSVHRAEADYGRHVNAIAISG